MDLRHITDSQLLKDTQNLIQWENELKTKFLHHIKEIDRRKLYSDLKCTSLHDYCVRVLKLTEAAAQRRIHAARLLVDLPEIEKKIESGALSLSNIANVVSFCNKQKINSNEQKLKLLERIENLSARECEKTLFQISGTELFARETQKRISDSKLKISMILSDQTMEKLKKLKGLLGKSLTQEELINHMADLAIAHVEKKKFKVNSKPSPPTSEVTGRYVSNKIKKAIYERDRQCENCGSIHHLNFDHRQPFALGGKSTEENLRLLCFQCNQRGRIRAKL